MGDRSLFLPARHIPASRRRGCRGADRAFLFLSYLCSGRHARLGPVERDDPRRADRNVVHPHGGSCWVYPLVAERHGAPRFQPVPDPPVWSRRAGVVRLCRLADPGRLDGRVAVPRDQSIRHRADAGRIGCDLRPAGLCRAPRPRKAGRSFLSGPSGSAARWFISRNGISFSFSHCMCWSGSWAQRGASHGRRISAVSP